MSESTTCETVALVLGGGGARGAYEAGALSVLLPVLEELGQSPRIVLGTSVGALNAAFVAANVERATAEMIERVLAIWTSISWGMVARPLVSASSLLRAGAYAGEVIGVRGVRLESLLDPETASSNAPSADRLRPARTERRCWAAGCGWRCRHLGPHRALGRLSPRTALTAR